MKSRRMRLAWHIARMGKRRNAFRLFVEKPEERRLLGRPIRRWVDKIRIYLVEVRWGDVDWIGLAQDMDRCKTIECPTNWGSL
jgi:hypothetical protein